MNSQLTTNAEALRLFFTEDVYLVKNDARETLTAPVVEQIAHPHLQPKVTSITETVVSAPPSISIPALKESTSASKKWDFQYLGKNQKAILILVNDANNAVSSPPGTELLRKLVKAIELTNSDFALVNFANYKGATFEDLKLFFNCGLLLSFGVTAEELKLPTQSLHQLSVLNQVKLIFTDNLHTLDSDTASKKILWSTLQGIK